MFIKTFQLCWVYIEMYEFYADLEIRDILKEKKKDDNLELHHKLMTSFWVAAVAFGEYLH